jgi:hypothetical protein
MKFVKNTWLPDTDTHFENMMDDEGNYQKKQFDAVLKYIEPKDRGLFIDVGAHVGLWSRMAIKAKFKSTFCFEPNDKNYECLLRNIRNVYEKFTDKNDDQIRRILEHNIDSCILSDCFESKLCLLTEKNDNSGSVKVIKSNGKLLSNTLDAQFYGATLLNKTKILDDLKNYKTLVKIDVQGYEHKVVKGMINFIKKYKPIIIVEQWLNGKEDLQATEYCQSLGMKILERVNKEVILGW